MGKYKGEKVDGKEGPKVRRSEGRKLGSWRAGRF
jgi:hypothetical protein